MNTRDSTRDYIRALSVLLSSAEPKSECDVEETVLTFTVEPFSSCASGVWICATAFHLESLRYHSELMISDVKKYQNAVATNGATPAELVDLLWDAFNDSRVDDLRLHAAVLCLYCNLIRDEVLTEMGIWSEVTARLQPGGPYTSAEPSLATEGEELRNLLERGTSLRGEGLAATASSLERTDEAIRAMLATATALAEQSERPYAEILQRFADAHEAALQLNSCLLRADVLARRLLFSMPGDQ